MPLKDLSLKEDICQYNGLSLAPSLPVPFKLAFFEPSMADAYHTAQRRFQYKAMRFILSSGRAEEMTFPSLKALEDENSEQIRAAALKSDRGLNQEQLEVIQSVLRGWKTKEALNDRFNLNILPSRLKEYLRNLGTISDVDLKWWGSRSCFIQGSPGTGNTRMLAALIAVILEHIEPQLRILVVCETNKALDDIFDSVLRLFKGKARTERHLQSMVRVGHSKVAIVKKGEIHHLKGRSASDAVDKARAVFTTFGSAYRRELSKSFGAFSLLLYEESCSVKHAMALFVLAVAFCRSAVTGGLFRLATLVCIGDSKQLQEEDYLSTPVSRTFRSHFFDKVFEDSSDFVGDTRMRLIWQYRMNPTLAGYISNQFYNRKLITETDGNLRWKDDSVFRSFRRHRIFPVRNVTVVDTSLQGRNSFETLGSGRSFYNSTEVEVIVNVLATWRADVGDEIARKVTIITTYARQRDEIIRSLNAKHMFFPVYTIDEFQGGESDIVIISLVRARRSSADDIQSTSASAIGFISRNERVNVAISRAKQGCMFIGHVKYIARHCDSLLNFFTECAENASEEDDGTYGYYRLRYVDFKRDLRFSHFNPSYL